MVDFFTSLYTRTINKNNLFNKYKLNSLFRFLIRNIANVCIPFYFNINNKFKAPTLAVEAPIKQGKLIVSLTSFPARINKLWLVIECILYQSNKPDRLILWLSKEQFPDINNLPSKLLKQRERGLEIYLREGDLRSHKKYYYALKDNNQNHILTIDDDVFYRKDFIKILLEYQSKHPKSIIINRGKIICHNNKEIFPYKDWLKALGEQVNRMDIIPTGVGGVLYFPGALHEMVINKEVFMETCPKADDLWLYFMAHINYTPFTKTDIDDYILPIYNKGNKTLTSENVDLNLNDEQFKRIHGKLNAIFQKEVLRFIN